MEANIVVLLDYESQEIQLFGEVNKIIRFGDAELLLPMLLEGRTVLYITHGDVVDGSDIIEQVAQLTIPEENPEKRYIHATVDGYTAVKDIGITFAGPRDARPLDKLGANVFERSVKLKELFIQGKVEIITETVALQMRKPIPNKNLKDKALDEILLNKSVSSKMEEQDEMWDGTDEITSDNSDKIMSDADEMIQKGYGKRE